MYAQSGIIAILQQTAGTLSRGETGCAQQKTTQNIKVGSRVCVIGNARNTCWETGIVEDINTEGALINYGSRNYPVYGKGIRVPLTGLEVFEA